MSDETLPIQPAKKRGRPKKVKNVSEVIVSDKKQDLETAANLLRLSGALFDTLDLDTYTHRLDNFSLNELHNEAFRVGLKGGADRTNCTRAILDIFNTYRGQHMRLPASITQKDSLTDEKRDLALRLMRDGK